VYDALAEMISRATTGDDGNSLLDWLQVIASALGALGAIAYDEAEDEPLISVAVKSLYMLGNLEAGQVETHDSIKQIGSTTHEMIEDIKDLLSVGDNSTQFTRVVDAVESVSKLQTEGNVNTLASWRRLGELIATTSEQATTTTQLLEQTQVSNEYLKSQSESSQRIEDILGSLSNSLNSRFEVLEKMIDAQNTMLSRLVDTTINHGVLIDVNAREISKVRDDVRDLAITATGAARDVKIAAASLTKVRDALGTASDQFCYVTRQAGTEYLSSARRDSCFYHSGYSIPDDIRARYQRLIDMFRNLE